MRVLLSTIGSRGDVQPLVALALQLIELGQEARICAPPDFGEWIGTLGIPFVPVGPQVRQTAAPNPPAAQIPPTPEQLRQLMHGTVAGQFQAITPAAKGCDLLVAGMALQFALHSIAEQMRIPYVYAAWSPITLPSPHHAPPPLPSWAQPAADGTADNRELWTQDAKRWNDQFAEAINSQREAVGLAPVADVRRHIFTDRPWLAADQTLAPWPPADLNVVQTGAWIRSDHRQLSLELETFLDAGEPPVYFGFGSMRAPQDLGEAIVRAARAVGRRAIVSRGWAGVTLTDTAPDCLSIGEINMQALFRRVAAVVHHGGAGTTTTAAQAGAPQVVVPQMYDQHYWASRVHQLGIGTAHAPGAPSADSLTEALSRTLQPDVAARARTVAASVRIDGAEVAARRLIDEFSRSAPGHEFTGS
jgi:vancomycin aglycone glucosyltransferase